MHGGPAVPGGGGGGRALTSVLVDKPEINDRDIS